MDDSIRQIRIEDIIPNDNQVIDKSELDDLKELVKKHGITEPLLLNEKSGKYEVILGYKNYLVAKELNLETIPALVKKGNNESISYESDNNPHKQNKFINPISLDNDISKDNSFNDLNNDKLNNNFKNTDIINLSELNKEEFERDEYKMNNNMNNMGMENQGMVNNQQTQQPTFGGRFFPSLEDEPTNMNMGAGMNIIGSALQNATPVSNPTSNNNLIDLTDTNNDNNFNNQPVQPNSIPVPEPVNPIAINQEMDSQPQPTPAPTNIEPAEPIPQAISNPQEPMMNEEFIPNYNNPNMNTGVNMNVGVNQEPNLNPIDNSVLVGEQPQIINNQQEVPQFDMSQSLNPVNNMPNQEQMIQEQPMPDFQNSEPVVQNQPMMNDFEPPINQNMGVQNNFEPPMNQNIEVQNNFESPMNQNMGVQNNFEQNLNPIPNMNENIEMPQPNINQGIELNNNQNLPPQMDNTIEQQFPQKEVTPVVETIKNLAINLQNFGYNINISEEDFPNIAKITIEIQK